MDVIALLADHKIIALLCGGLLFPMTLKATEHYFKQISARRMSTLDLTTVYRSELERKSLEIIRLQDRLKEKEDERERLLLIIENLRAEVASMRYKILELEFKREHDAS